MNTKTPGLLVEQLSVRRDGRLILDNIHLRLGPRESLAIVGQSGSGKTTLIQALSGGLMHQGRVMFSAAHGGKARVRVIGRQHRLTNLSNISSFYYQQRFNSFDAEDSRTVWEELQPLGASSDRMVSVLDTVGLAALADSRLIQLSNGEHKRFQLAEALLQSAAWLLLDSPYTGLDKAARVMLGKILDDLSQAGTSYILVTGPGDIPGGVSRVDLLENSRLQEPMSREQFLMQIPQEPGSNRDLPSLQDLLAIPAAYTSEPFEIAVRMNNVTIRYDNRTILDNINWEVRHGEGWHLAGPNGSGKSTLLSLVNADNPQAFSQDIWLFDRRKGSGESIWDIKRKIGYVSPELHHYFEDGTIAFNLVASGLFDTMGLFRQLNPFQEALVSQWMELLGIAQLSQRYFHRLSDGEQRMVLLARAMVKHPPMLILDQPCQGLDDAETKAFTGLVDQLCGHLGKTLIYVSHYASELPACITHRLVLDDGYVIQKGPL